MIVVLGRASFGLVARRSQAVSVSFHPRRGEVAPRAKPHEYWLR